ncbi:MAG TPA: YgeY family selenium metabolism-linked hydrolase [Anaerolineales bacterium]|nr:YgeY family selenium metabolism-linked hydrolase [Anaerolineae bacterium]HIQ02353.1 YgeY family selenium metabolism-linked hydrolase [Anaerolineales bacterium]
MVKFQLNDEEREELTAFLQDLVRIPSPPTQEGPLAERIVTEMERLGLRDVRVDRIGNVIGWVGADAGPVLMLNGHMDTVGVSNAEAWTHDPFGAQIEQDRLYGLGACDMKGGLAAMVYGARLLRRAGLPAGGRVVVACVVQEEPCEGLASRVLIEEEGVRPDGVLIAEPSDLQVARGQRGRIELQVTTYGRSAHASQPELGENAIYTAARLVFGLELLADQLAKDPFLGQGTLAVTDIQSEAGSRNAVPYRCDLIIDRRLTLGETEATALAEIQRTIAREGVHADVQVTEYTAASYTGYPCRAREFYPPWVIEEDHPLVAALVRATRAQLGRRPQVGYWNFSTEGAYTAGVAGIPTVGFGPGDPRQAHTVDESVSLKDVCSAAEVYARLAVELLTPDV